MRPTVAFLTFSSTLALASSAFAQSVGDGELMRCDNPIGTYQLINSERSEISAEAERVMHYVLGETRCFSGTDEESDTTITIREVDPQPRNSRQAPRLGGNGLLGSIINSVRNEVENQHVFYAPDVGIRSRTISPIYHSPRTLNTSMDYSRYPEVNRISRKLGIQDRAGYFFVAATIEAVNSQLGPIVRGARNKQLIEERFEARQAARQERNNQPVQGVPFEIDSGLKRRYSDDPVSDTVFNCFRVVAEQNLEAIQSIRLTDAEIDDYLAENTRTGKVSSRSIFYGMMNITFEDGRIQFYRASCRPIAGGIALGDLQRQ